MGVKIGGKVEKVSGKELSYADFVEKYLGRNQPVILTGLTGDWRACKDWVSDDGKPNLRFFSEHFGGSRVQVADCGTREFTDQKRVEMSVSEFVDRWLEISGCDNGGADGKSLLYLKDWHFVKEYPDYVAYSTPIFFLDDWLNHYLDKYHMHDDPDSYQERNEISCSDYRFVYMGTKGTWTPLHADVFRSYSWSANVCGRKQWYFLSPSQHHLVFDRYMKASVYDIFEEVCKTKYPGFEKAIWLECTQEQNEIIFVPSGWYHQVHNLYGIFQSPHKGSFDHLKHRHCKKLNSTYGLDLPILEQSNSNGHDIKKICLFIGPYKEADDNDDHGFQEDTVSINHNWFNAYNISWVWDLLLREYHEAKGYIEDIKDVCDDFEGLCQRNLAANAGMDFRDFFNFMIRFALANTILLHQLTSDKINIKWSSSQQAWLLLFNLRNIQSVAAKMKSVAAWVNRDSATINIRETIEDQSFVEFCSSLGRTYGMAYSNSEINVNPDQNLLENKQLYPFDRFGSHICNPDELISFVDYAFKLVGTEG